MKKFARNLVHKYRGFRKSIKNRKIFIVNDQPEKKMALLRKADFFFNESAKKIEFVNRFSLKPFFHSGPIVYNLIKGKRMPKLYRLINADFDINAETCAMEAWHWFDAEVELNGRPDRSKSKINFERWRGRLPKALREKVYLFGTGPSLGLANERDWSDGTRIVCNTIVRDPELWHHIEPHAIVAGDALYHFGYTDFARAFRRDLLMRLNETPEAVFIYPDYFHSRVVRDIEIEPHRLIPIETGDMQTVHSCIADSFELPALGNVLNKLLLPIGCSVSKNLKLWGFDGRAPTDKLFWANSNKHSYPELMDTLKEAHPAFFDHFVPKSDPESYVRSVHGDVLDFCLTQAEKNGFTVEMLHASWTPTLQKRMHSDG